MLPSYAHSVAVSRRAITFFIVFVISFHGWRADASDATSQTSTRRDQTERALATAQRRLNEMALRVRVLDDSIREANARSGVSEIERNKRLSEFERERMATLNESNFLIGLMNKASRAAEAGREFSFSEKEIDAISGKRRKPSNIPWLVGLVLACVVVKFLWSIRSSL